MDDQPERCILIGGHRDGDELTIPDALPLVSTHSTLAQFTRGPADDPANPTFRVIDYHLVLDNGHPSRDDQGRLRYRC